MGQPGTLKLIGALNPEVHAVAMAAIEKAISRPPDQRYISAAIMRQALRSAANSAPPLRLHRARTLTDEPSKADAAGAGTRLKVGEEKVMRGIVLLLLCLLSIRTALAQSPQILSSNETITTSKEKYPQLRKVERKLETDKLYTIGDNFAYLRSGSKIPLPLTGRAPLSLVLDSTISTDGMVGIEVPRSLQLKLPIQSPFGQNYAIEKGLVETRFSGHKSGFKTKALLTIDPEMIQVVIDQYIQVDTKDNIPVYLQPGRWKFELQCSFKQAVSPEEVSWYAGSCSECNGITGQSFGVGGKKQSQQDVLDGLIYIHPYGYVAYGISKMGNAVTLIFNRPNIVLPRGTEIFFQIDRIEATFLGNPVPDPSKSSAAPIDFRVRVPPIGSQLNKND